MGKRLKLTVEKDHIKEAFFCDASVLKKKVSIDVRLYIDDEFGFLWDTEDKVFKTEKEGKIVLDTKKLNWCAIADIICHSVSGTHVTLTYCRPDGKKGIYEEILKLKGEEDVVKLDKYFASKVCLSCKEKRF